MTPRNDTCDIASRTSARGAALVVLTGALFFGCSGTNRGMDSGSGGWSAASGGSGDSGANTGPQTGGSSTAGGALDGSSAASGGFGVAGSGGASALAGGALASGGGAVTPGTHPAGGNLPVGGTSAGGAKGGMDGGAMTTGGSGAGGTSTGGYRAEGTLTGGSAGAPMAGIGAATDASGGSGTGGTLTGDGGAMAGDTGGGGAIPGGAGGALTGTTVWIAGDSTVANGSTPCPVGWGKHFEGLFNDLVTVVNSARGGRSVRTWLYSVQTVMEGNTGECALDKDGSGNPIVQDGWQAMLDGMRPGDYLLIQFGINDGSATCDRHVGLDAFKESYGMMAQAAKDRSTQPIFLTPAAAIGCSGNTAIKTRGEYVTATIEAGATYDVPVIELHQLLVDSYNSMGFCPVPGGDVSASTTGPLGDFFCDDHTHFSDSGAVQVAALVAQALRDQAIGLAAYLE